MTRVVYAGTRIALLTQHGKERVNKKRTLQLLDTGATKVASGWPFCMTLLTGGVQGLVQTIEQEHDLLAYTIHLRTEVQHGR